MKKLRKSRKVSMAAGLVAAIFAAGGLIGCFIPAKLFFGVMIVIGLAVAALIYYGYTGYDDKQHETEGNKGKGGNTPQNQNQPKAGTPETKHAKGYVINGTADQFL